jgi:hypothetical protein
MLKGKELGKAIETAINLKLASGAVTSKKQIAEHFDVKPPSVHDWIKKGSISKDKLPKLWDYFSDVVKPEHWGLTTIPYRDKPDGVETIKEKKLAKFKTKRQKDIHSLNVILEKLNDDDFEKVKNFGQDIARYLIQKHNTKE